MKLRIMNYELGGRGIVRGKRSCKGCEFLNEEGRVLENRHCEEPVWATWQSRESKM